MAAAGVSGIDAATRRRLLRYQIGTVILLFAGYAAYYFCRSDLSVATPLIIDDLRRQGIDSSSATIQIGRIASFGVLAYAIGKLTLASVADFVGGRRNFIGGLAGAAFFSILFLFGGSIPVFTFAWIGNRYAQSGGWAGLVKIAGGWFSYSSYGTAMALLSISYLVGDAAARQAMGAMIHLGFGWRSLFLFAAAVAFALLLVNAVFLKGSRRDAGLPEPEVNPLNLFRQSGGAEKPARIRSLLGTLLGSPVFLLVCLLSLGCTLVRETFNTWTPTYFHQFLGFAADRAASASALFPLIGAVSVLLAGWGSDRLGAGGRAVISFFGLLLSVLALLLLSTLPHAGLNALHVGLVGAVAFGLLGPYSYLAGAMAMDFGGRQGSAASSGLIDGIGYIGGILAGDSMARISVSFGWQGAFLVLGAVCFLSALAAAGLFFSQTRRAPGKPA